MRESFTLLPDTDPLTRSIHEALRRIKEASPESEDEEEEVITEQAVLVEVGLVEEPQSHPRPGGPSASSRQAGGVRRACAWPTGGSLLMS